MPLPPVNINAYTARCDGSARLTVAARTRPIRQATLYPRTCFLFCANSAVQLRLAHGVEEFLEKRSGFVAGLDQIVAGEQERRIEVISGPLAQQLLAVFDVVDASAAGQGIGAVQFQQFVDAGMDQQRLELARPHLADVARN